MISAIREEYAIATLPAWGVVQRLAFRFSFVYWILYNLPFPIGTIPGTTWIQEKYDQLWLALIPWIGKHVLHINSKISGVQTGSGDKLYDYLQLLCFLVLATTITIIWSILDRKRTEYRKLHDWLRVYIRYALGTIMLSYGSYKVVKLQFPFPSLERLVEPYGQSSPMGLLWAFMGYSTPYTFFAGAIEVIGGFLLFFRRTTTLGALIVVAGMSNVVMMNFSYDVPVKLYSSNLLLMVIFLLIPDFRRLANFLVLNRPAAAADLENPLFATRRMQNVRIGVKILLIGSILFVLGKDALDSYEQYGQSGPPQSLYVVEEFTKNHQAPAPNDASLWRKVVLSDYKGQGRFCVLRMDDTLERFVFTKDGPKKTITLRPRVNMSEKYVFTFSQADPDHILMEGKILNDLLTIRLRKIQPPKFLLVNRGFHWINEVPYNR